MSQNIPVITIDGPTASGKGTVASSVAARLGFHYLDSGALYRIAALACIKAGTDLADAQACAAVARAISPVFEGQKILLEGSDVSLAIRQEAVGVAASRIAVHPPVRQALFELQRSARKAPGLVADGRDMGAVIFPDATLKVFLTASARARAERRFKQLSEKGIQANMCDLVRDLEERDRRDIERAASPLAPAPGAKLLDSSDLTVEQTVGQVLAWYEQV